MPEKKESTFKNLVNHLQPEKGGCCDVQIEEDVKEHHPSSEQKSSAQQQ